MNAQPTEITEQNLRLVRKQKGLSQAELAPLLGLETHHLSKIESGRRQLSPAEKTVLDWYFFGTVPPRIESIGIDPRSLLEFSEGEWRIIGIIAKRHGLTERQWIGSRIRDYLGILGELATDHEPPVLKVADDPILPEKSESA